MTGKKRSRKKVQHHKKAHVIGEIPPEAVTMLTGLDEHINLSTGEITAEPLIVIAVPKSWWQKFTDWMTG